MLPVKPKETVSMVTRDGVRLDADLYRPEGEGPFPVLLMRQPYGRAIASTVVYAHPEWYAAHGYLVVIQDVRGRGTSEGTFRLFADEITDGEDTVRWAAALPGSSGRVGMYGFSYQGMTQLYAAIARPPELQALCPAMIGYDLHRDWAYEGGAFCLQMNLGWALQLATETARLRGDEAAYHALLAASRQLPLGGPVPANPQILRDLAPDSFYHDWLAHPDPQAEYWRSLSPQGQMDAVDLPMLHIGGWFDTYLRGTLRFYRDRAEHRQKSQALLVGPWGHLPWGRRVGDRDYGPAAESPVDRWQIAWFDRWLKDQPEAWGDRPPVTLFEMGRNQWRSLPSWPTVHPQRFFLTSHGEAGIRTDDGRLTPQPPSQAGRDRWVHDPWRPVPAAGGHASFPAGPVERGAVDCRSDVLTYSSAPLDAELCLAGDLRLEVFCQADVPSFDLCAVLSEVLPDGRVYAFSQGYRRIDTPQAQPIALALQPTCQTIAPGSALRLSLSAACFPAFPVNPGTSDRAQSARTLAAQIVTLRLDHGGDRPSQLILNRLDSPSP